MQELETRRNRTSSRVLFVVKTCVPRINRVDGLLTVPCVAARYQIRRGTGGECAVDETVGGMAAVHTGKRSNKRALGVRDLVTTTAK